MMETVATTLGEMLRAARESKKQSLDAVNQETKIAISVLEALEQDEFDTFESDIYLKGFLRNYAQHLGLEVDDVLRSLDRLRGGRKSSGGTLWDIEGNISEEKLKSPNIFRRFVLPLLLLSIIVLLFLFLNERRKVQRLTPGGAQGYLTVETPDSRST